MNEKWKIGLVEDRREFRDYIRKLLQGDARIESFTAWESAETFLRDPVTARLDLVFVDIMLPHMNGIELVRTLNERQPEQRTVILTTVSSEDIIFEALKSGAVGYILKAELPDLPASLETIMSGGAIISPTIALRVFQYFHRPAAPEEHALTGREKQVLEQMMTGASAQEVADILDVAVGTIRNHVKNIYRKMNVHNKLELARKLNWDWNG